MWDHPRVCGEKSWSPGILSTTMGSPPRMRGKELFKLQGGDCRGITPAYAGKSLSITKRNLINWDHPRVCGEKRTLPAAVVVQLGSPPRMRGKVPGHGFLRGDRGITPAYAGKSSYLLDYYGKSKDHPRVCGEKTTEPFADVASWGSPPRMRGKAFSEPNIWSLHGITPAYAGKSRTRDRIRTKH